MEQRRNTKVSPVSGAKGFNNPIRRMFHNPYKILNPYLKPGMSVLDLGCGPGYFTVEIARLLNNEGRIVGADLQQGMLDILAKRIEGNDIPNIIELHRCGVNNIGLKEQFDFILAFYMVHEVPNQKKLFDEFKSLIKPSGRILVVEPKVHVSEKEYKKMIETITSSGFSITEKPQIFFSRSVLLSLSK